MSKCLPAFPPHHFTFSDFHVLGACTTSITMASRSLQPGSQSQLSLSDSRSTSEKSYNGNDESRSPSKVGGLDELQQPERSISFDSRFTQDDRKDDTSPSKSPQDRRMPHEIETPTGPVRRDTLHSLSALSTHTDPADRPSNTESKWPKDYRAWLCLLGGFLLMFNSWGMGTAEVIVCLHRC